MKSISVYVTVIVLMIVSCKSKTEEGEFKVNGKISNSQAKMIYLEEIPVATMQRIIVDSASLDKNGEYELTATAKEATVFNLRLDQNPYPLASLINDSKKVTVNASYNSQNPQFTETYEVKNSEASSAMKSFMERFNGKLQAIFMNMQKADSLRQLNPNDSAILALDLNAAGEAQMARNIAMDHISKTKNPALVMYILGYYQTSANNPNFKLAALTNDEVSGIVNRVHNENPAHAGVLAIKTTLDAQVRKSQGLIGLTAPEFSMTDTEGKVISLSSYRGKYVLVDFWASWCKPCRAENPNLVRVYNTYKDKNFTILGVALERPGQRDEWLKAIKDDNLSWKQLSDLQFWNSPVVAQYGIEGIPFNVLLDTSGKVIAQGLRGEMLDAKLREVIK